MAEKILMPKQGNTVETCVLNHWLKEEGDVVEIGDEICEIETDKSTMMVESSAKGVMLKILCFENDDVPVQDVIAIVGRENEDISHILDSLNLSSELKSAKNEDNEKLHIGTKMESQNKSKCNEVGISHLAKILAKKHSINYQEVIGTGPKGRIIARDIEVVIGEGIRNQTQSFNISIVEKDNIVHTLKGTQKISAERMKKSLDTTAQLTLQRIVNAEKLLEVHKLFKEKKEDINVSISINDLILYVVSRSLLKTSLINSHFNVADYILTEYPYVNLGYAVDTEKGLMVPVIKHANNMSFSQMIRETRRLTENCKEGKVSPNDLSDGTFTVSNLGAKKIDYFTPVLNIPETAILGVGSIRVLPVEKDDHICFEKHIFLSLTFNHQAFDGMYASKFLEVLAINIERIDWLFYGEIL